MTREAKVVREGGKLMAEVIRQEACQSCHACQFGQQERVLVELPEGKAFQEGETIVLELEDGLLSKAVLLAYVLPLALLLAGLFLGARLGGEGVQALCALAGLGLGLLAVRWISRRGKVRQPTPCKKA